MKLRDVGFTIGFASIDDGEEHPAIRDEQSGTVTLINSSITRDELIERLMRKPYWHKSPRVTIRPATIYCDP